VWNLGAAVPTVETTIRTTGKVTHIEVKDGNVLWAVDEPIAPDQPNLTVGTVHLLSNPQTMSTIAVKVYIFYLVRYFLIILNHYLTINIIFYIEIN
jgi:hypothetical protein